MFAPPVRARDDEWLVDTLKRLPKRQREGVAPATEFTANQGQTHVEHDPPYDKYHGTAPPGTEIRAGNDHGSATGVADEKGNWYVKVWFEDAPYGTHTFTVKVGPWPPASTGSSR